MTPDRSSGDAELSLLLSDRVALTVQRLRLQVERCSVRQSRQRRAAVNSQRHRMSNAAAMDQQVNVLEGLLRAWMPHILSQPDFAVAADSSVRN